MIRRAALILGLALLPAPGAHAIDPALCADDAVVEVPPFALGRDVDQCLLLDPGTGAPPVPFQYEIFHATGISEGCNNDPPLPGTTLIDHNMDAYGRCPTKTAGQYCTLLFWDTTFDNYLDPACRNEDILFWGDGLGIEVLYLKDSVIANAWKCSGGDWDGPNGIGCPASEDSSAHTDGIQLRGNPVNDGWLVLQDSRLLNAHINLLLFQVQADYPPNGSALFQGVELGQMNTPVGEAKNWIDDCLARGSDISTCRENRAQIGYQTRELWLVDVHGGARFSKIREGPSEKLVVVNTGCGPFGCDGEIAYFEGWPHPLEGSETGPGSCPNGLITESCVTDETSTACYCYTSLEQALADQPTATAGPGDCPHCPHARPPFLQLSPAGWQTPPGP